MSNKTPLGLQHLIQVKHFLHCNVTTRDDGAVLRNHLASYWDYVDCFRIDFQRMQVASVSFIDEAFGMLAESHSRKEIEAKLKLLNMNQYDKQMFESILASRTKQFRKNKGKSGVVQPGQA